MMLHIPAVLSRAQVCDMRARLAHSDWVDGRASVGAQGALVKRNRQLPENSELSIELGPIIQTAVAAHPLFFAAALPRVTCPPLFNYYAGGEHYGLHVDGAIRQLPGTQHSMRTDLSSTLFLSDPEEYEGGELVVVDTYGTHQVKLPAGDMILYPASSLHQVEPVTNGARICSFFWTQSLVRNDWQRSLLFELDQNIQQLRGKLGDCPELVSLTGHYHNLLRQWTEL
ncbi:Fe2+-dependent dioxygenase [soil metagenome]